MECKDVLKIVLREMCSIGNGWRHNWCDFDGRQLMHQLNYIRDYAEQAIKSNEFIDYTDGSDFEKMKSEE